MPSELIPAIAFGPLGRPADEELRFWRLIEARVLEEDGIGELVELACGHTTICVTPLPDTQEYAYCSQCLNLWVDSERRHAAAP